MNCYGVSQSGYPGSRLAHFNNYLRASVSSLAEIKQVKVDFIDNPMLDHMIYFRLNSHEPRCPDTDFLRIGLIESRLDLSRKN